APPPGLPRAAVPRAYRQPARARLRAPDTARATIRSFPIPARQRCGFRISSLAQFQCGESEQDEEHGDDPKAHDDLVLLPALELVVMMERRHAEHAPARELERDDLHDDR